ncbi:chromate transporter [Oceanispirochaeta sp.]|jgi:chromate transporter|uniref:chromate transporter n=1 Tax=Oceanispirochaeta sp. TaxID=2035350 RepID=UPI002606963E|nr:chromate transporter [Oceanispirochaeta sp.]MDA3958072.1 chromate transporter [Oceanispirochaeta sp.]
MSFLTLYLIFFKIGLFTIGGGLAALPLLQNEAMKRQWFSQAEFFHMVAVSESTPGPIGVNMATYIGWDYAGIAGSLVATFGLVSPSLIIIILIARYFFHFNEKPLVQSALSGLRPAVTGLIATAAFNVLTVAVFPIQTFRENGLWGELFDPATLILFVLIVAAYVKWKAHPVFYVAAAAAAGMIFL